MESEKYIALISSLLYSEEESVVGQTLNYLSCLKELVITEHIALDIPQMVRRLVRAEALEYWRVGDFESESKLYLKVAIELRSLISKVPDIYQALIKSAAAFWEKESKQAPVRGDKALAKLSRGSHSHKYSLRELSWFDRCLFPEDLAKELAHILKYGESEYELLKQELIQLQKSGKLSVVALWQRWINSKALLLALDKIVYDKVSEFMR